MRRPFERGGQPLPKNETSTHEIREPKRENETENETEHENENAEDNGAKRGGPFLHEKLEAYQVALKMALLAKKVSDEIPRGYRNVADHLLRSASNTVLLLAEGANRRGSAEKRQRFVESRGECGEVGAAADLVLGYKIADRAEADSLKRLAARVGAMLTRLIGRFENDAH